MRGKGRPPQAIPSPISRHIITCCVWYQGSKHTVIYIFILVQTIISVQAKLEVVRRKNIFHLTGFGAYSSTCFKVTVPKRSIRVKIGDLLSCVTLKFDGWPWKTIGYLFYDASSFMHHFIAIGELKLKFQSGNGQFGSKSAIFCPSDLEIRQMTLKNNRAPLLCYIKLCASFHNHCWIQTGVTVWKRPIWVQIDDF